MYWLLSTIFALFLAVRQGADASSMSLGSAHRRVSELLHYDVPQLTWKQKLPGDERIGKGNVVATSPIDRNNIYVTTRSGKLFVVSSSTGKVVSTIQPPIHTVRGTDGKLEAWKTRCSSGVSFGEVEGLGKLLVYAVVDHPPETKEHLSPTSRVIAVLMLGESHEMIWQSMSLDGEIQGTPVINTNHGHPSKKYIFVSRNTQISKPDGSNETFGQLTMLRASTGETLWNENEADLESSGGYGPLGIAHNPQLGKYSEGIGNESDMIVWTSSTDDGHGNTGYTFGFQLPSPSSFEGTSAQIQSLGSKKLKRVRWTSITKPTLTEDGNGLFVSVTGSELRGWAGNRFFDKTATWSFEMLGKNDDPGAPASTSVVLSKDEKRLFASSGGHEIGCHDTDTGDLVWRTKGTSRFLSEARVSPDDQRVYNIQSSDGLVFCQDQRTGYTQWMLSCDLFEEDCANTVHADFSLSMDGQYLFYGDVTGMVLAMKLAEESVAIDDQQQETTYVFPGDIPSSDLDSQSQSTKNDKRTIPLGGKVSLALVATMLIVGSLVFIHLQRQLKTFPQPYYEDDPDFPQEIFEERHEPQNQLYHRRKQKKRHFQGNAGSFNGKQVDLMVPFPNRSGSEGPTTHQTMMEDEDRAVSEELSADRGLIGGSLQKDPPNHYITSSEQGNDYAFGTSVLL